MSRYNTDALSYTTLKEKNYLSTIGEHREIWKTLSARDKVLRKIYLLNGYLNAAVNRFNWGNLDKGMLIGFAKQEIIRLGG